MNANKFITKTVYNKPKVKRGQLQSPIVKITSHEEIASVVLSITMGRKCHAFEINAIELYDICTAINNRLEKIIYD